MFSAEDHHLSPVSNLSSLTSLDVSQCAGVTTKGLSCLSSLPYLTSLNASFCPQISDRILHYLTANKSSPITIIKLKNCPGIRNTGLRRLPLLSSLTSLDLQFCPRIKDCGMASICRIPSLKSLNVADCMGLSVASLRNLAECPSLVDLNISNCQGILNSATPEDFAHIPASVTRLSLVQLGVSDDHLSHMTHLASLSCLLLHCKYPVAAMNSLSRFTCLEELAVVGNPHQETLCLVSTLPSLRNLTLSCQMSREGLRSLCTSTLTSTLTSLSLQGVRLQSGTEPISCLTSLRTLRVQHSSSVARVRPSLKFLILDLIC